MRKLIIFLLLISFTLFGRKYYVPEDFYTIQEAIISACREETISVFFGERNLNQEKIYVKEKVLGKDLTFELRSGSKGDLFKMFNNIHNLQSFFSTDRNVPPYGWQGMRTVLEENETLYRQQTDLKLDEYDNAWVIGGEKNTRTQIKRVYIKYFWNNQWGPSIYVDPCDSLWECRHQIEVINSRNIFGVWACIDGSHNIFYTKYNGRTWSIPREVTGDTSSVNDEYVPKIDYGGNKLWVIWFYGDYRVVDYTVYGSCWNWERGEWETPVRISPRGRAGYSCHWFASIAVDKRGKPHVVWSEPYSGAIYYCTTNEQGRWLEPRIINDPGIIRCAGWGCTAIDVDDKGRIYVAWLGYNRNNEFDYEIFYQFSADGNEFTWPRKVEENEVDDYPLVEIWGESPNDVWVYWEIYDHIYVSHFDGIEWEKPVLLDDGNPSKLYAAGGGDLNSYGEPWVVFARYHPKSEVYYSFYLKKGFKPNRVADNQKRIIMVPEDYPEIQRAIKEAQDGDTISVWKWPWEPFPKIYYENIDFRGKNILITNRGYIDSNLPRDSTLIVIDGQQNSSVVTFSSNEQRKAILQGFTITNGCGQLYGEYYYGGGVFCLNSSPTIIRNHIFNNRINSIGRGGGIAIIGADAQPKISYNSIEKNYAFQVGGGITFEDTSAPEIENNLIYENSAWKGGGIYGFNENPLSEPRGKIYGNIIKRNTAYHEFAACFYNATPIIRENIFIENGLGEIHGNVIACEVFPIGSDAFPDFGTFVSLGKNIFKNNGGERDLVFLGEETLYAQGNYWGSLDKDTLNKRIHSSYGVIEYDPVAASNKYFSIIYNSRCTTSVIIDGKLSVEKDITLTIKEGRSFYFLNEGSFLLILGNLDAIGQEFLPIKFIPYPYSPIQKWGGIVIDGTGNFEWCEIKKGYNGISGGGGLTGVISVNNSKIESCEVSGLYLKNPYRVEISNSSIADNGVYGIYISSEIIFIPVLWINNNQILRNGRYGIYWEEVNVGATNIIQSNKITGWRDPNDPNAGSLYGIYLTKNPTASIPTVMMFANNSISNFSQGGICIQGSFPIEITGKGTIFNNTYYGIYSTLNSRPKIRWTEINFNKAGVYADYYSYPDLGTINDSGYNQILLGNYYWVVNHNPEPQEPIYAQCNWWGTAEPDTLPWKFIGWVIYYPWLTSPPWEEEFTSSQVSNLNKITSPVLNISPNIIKDKLNIKYFLPKEEEVSLILYDNNGRKVKLIDKGKKDKNEISLLTKDLNNGLYFLILRGKDFNLKRKLIILK